MSDSRISYSTVERFVSKTQQEILLRWWFRVKGHANVALLEFKRGDKLRSYAFAIAHILAASSFVYTTYIVYNVQLRKDREACVQAEAGAAESEGTFSMLGCIMAFCLIQSDTHHGDSTSTPSLLRRIRRTEQSTMFARRSHRGYGSLTQLYASLKLCVQE